MIKFLIILIVIRGLTKASQWLNCGGGYFQSPTSLTCSLCPSSCSDCSLFKGTISQNNTPFCLSCQNGNFFNPVNGDCVKTCPVSTRPNSTLNFCEPCLIQNCQQCSQSAQTCSQCQANFQLVNNRCEESISKLNSSNNKIVDNFVSEIQCTNIVDNIINTNKNLIQYSFFDLDNSSIFVFTTFKVQKYNTSSLQLLSTGTFPYNGTIADCGFYQGDLINFYCTAHPNYLIQYHRNLLNQTLIATFNGTFQMYFSSGISLPKSYFGSLHQKYDSGMITSFLQTGIQVFSFQQQNNILYNIQSSDFINENYAYLSDLSGFILYDSTRDNVFFKTSSTSDRLIMSKQTGFLYSYETLDSNNILFLHKNGASVCKSSQITAGTNQINLSTDCYPQNTPLSLSQYSYPSTTVNLQSDSLLVFYQTVHGVLLIYDYSQGPQQVNLVFGKLNYTLNYQYLGQKNFIHLNTNYQLSLLAISSNGQLIETLSPPITQFIFLMSFSFQFFQNAIIIVNSKQALAIKYTIQQPSQSSTSLTLLQQFQLFLSSNSNFVEIQPMIAEEPLLNYDYIIQAFYDANLQLYIFVKNFQVRLKYTDSSIYGQLEIMYDLEQNGGYVIQAYYVQSQQILIVTKLTQQIILSIPSLQLIRKDNANLIGEVWNIFYQNNQVITAALDMNNNFQFLSTTLTSNAFYISPIYSSILDFFIRYNKVVILNTTMFYVVTISTQQTQSQQLDFSVIYDSNIFYNIGTSYYLALFQQSSPPSIIIYNLDATSFGIPFATLSFPSVPLISSVFDYYSNTFSLYTIQFDGIYAYELDSTNVFIQKSTFANTVIQNFQSSPYQFRINNKKIIASTPYQGVILIDKIVKSYSLIQAQASQILNVILLTNSMNSEILLITNPNNSLLYIQTNGIYKLIQMIEGTCENGVRLLDSSELFYPQSQFNNAYLIPVNNFNTLSLNNYANPITQVLIDSTQRYLAINIQNNLIKVLKVSPVQENIQIQYTLPSGQIYFLFYDQNLSMLLYLANLKVLFSYIQGEQNPTLLASGGQYVWSVVLQNLTTIIIDLFGQLYFINYSTQTTINIVNLVTIISPFPANTAISQYDRVNQSIYITFSKIKVLSFSVQTGILQGSINLNSGDIFISVKRTDQNIIRMTTQTINLYSSTTFQLLSSTQFTNFVDSFVCNHLTITFIFCKPQSTYTGYFININTLQINPLVFRSIIYSVGFQESTNTVLAITNDNILSIYNNFSQTNSSSFILQEFSEDVNVQILSSSSQISIEQQSLFNLDCVILTFNSNLYVYSISKQQIINIIRNSQTILNFWVIGTGVLLFYDVNGVYYYDLYSILQLQPRFHLTRYLFNEIDIHTTSINNNLIGNIETLSNLQVKFYNSTDGSLINSYQLRKSYMQPIIFNPYLFSTVTGTNNQNLILIRIDTIYIINQQTSLITDSYTITNMNAVTSVSSSLLNGSTLYIVSSDNSVRQINVITKSSVILSIQISNILFIADLMNISLIFSYNENAKQNNLMCLNKLTSTFYNLTTKLNSYNLSKVFKTYQIVLNYQIIAQTTDGYLYFLTFDSCTFSSTPTLAINQIISQYFYDQNQQYLFVQLIGDLTLYLIQNNQLVPTSIQLPSETDVKFKISNDQSFYIIFSKLFISVYTCNDFKLKVQINDLFVESEIKDIVLISSQLLIVITQTEVFSFELQQNSYYLSLQYSIKYPILFSYSIQSQQLTTQVSQFVQLSFFSIQGAVSFQIPIISYMQNSEIICYYQLSLDSDNEDKRALLLSDKINLLNQYNSKNNNIQVIDSIIFTLDVNETLYKLNTIINSINTLILNSGILPQQSSIVVDQSFYLINKYSNNVFLQNTNLIFQESATSAQIATPNLDISNKNIVYFINIQLIGYLKSYYFNFNSDNFFRADTLTISNLIIDASNKMGFAFFNFNNTQIIHIYSLVISNLQFSNDFVFFSIRNAQQIIIDTITIQNINCQTLTIFDLGTSTNLKITTINIRNVNCQLFQFIKSFLINTITLQSVIFNGVTQAYSQQAIVIQSVYTLTIKDLEVSNCNGMNILSVTQYIQDNINYEVNSINVNILRVQNSQDYLQRRFRTLQQEETQNSYMIYISNCQSIVMSNVAFYQIGLFSTNFLYFNTQSFSMYNFELNNISTLNNIISQIYFVGQSVTLVILNMIKTNNLVILTSNVDKFSLLQSTVTNNVINSKLSTYGLLSSQNVNNVIISNSLFTSNIINYPSSGVLNFLNVIQFELDICTFNLNQSVNSNGSCLYVINQELTNIGQIQQTPSLINKCKFISNSSQNGFGGALYIQEQNIQIQSSLFSQNSALIGGAIKINSLIIIPNFYITIMKKKSSGNVFDNNIGALYGKNVGYFPSNLKIIVDKHISYFNGQSIQIKNFESNSQLDNIMLLVVDNEGNQINFPTDEQRIQNIAVDQEFLKYQFVINQIQSLNIFVSQSQILLTDYQYFVVNATVIVAPLTANSLSIQSSSTTPIIQLTSNSYTVSEQVNINSRDCQIGDEISKINNLVYCQPCPIGQYSMQVPNLSKSQSILNCQYCPTSSVSCQGSTINLKNGYWRESNSTDTIYSCVDQISSCKAQDSSSINLCGRGYVGPLCQSCDTMGVTWGEKYSLNSGQICLPCSETGIQILTFIGYLVLVSVYFILIVFQNIQCSKKKILRYYTERLIGISLGWGIDYSRNSALLKILMNYFQIYLILDGSGFKLPNQTSSFSFLGDPSLNLVTKVDCVLSISSPKEIILYRILFKFFSIALLFLLCIGAMVGSYLLDTSKSKRLIYYAQYASMVLKVIFLYGGFGIVTDGVRALSCITIGSSRYRLYDLRIKCASNVSEDADVYILATLLVVSIAIIIPLLLFLQIKKITNQKRTQRIQVLKSYNFLFQEYKAAAVYWEIVKIMMKYFIIFVINFFESDLYSKIQLTLLILIWYNIILLRVQPYENKSFNNTDLYSMFTLQITLICTTCILSISNEFISYLLLIIIVVINSSFLIHVFLFFIRGLKISIDLSTRNPFKKLINKIVLKLQKFLKIQAVREKQGKRGLILWLSLKRKIVKKDCKFFSEYLKKRVFENKLYEKQLNISQIMRYSNEKSNKERSQFKLELPTSQKIIDQQYVSDTTPRSPYIDDNTIALALERQKSNSISNPHTQTQNTPRKSNYSGTSSFSQQLYQNSYPLIQQDEIKQFTQENQLYDLSHPSEDDHSQTTEMYKDGDRIKIYKSLIQSKNYNVLRPTLSNHESQ